MSVDDLSRKYMCLRAELALAYGEPVWNRERIDTLTDEIADTEFALAASGKTSGVFHPAYAASTGVGTAVARF